MKLLGVILSGGKSSRMGTDKGLLEYQGKPMVEYSIELLKSYCDELVISTNSLDYLEFGYQTIPDLIPDIGPIGGMFSVMTMLKADYYFFVSCDIPHSNNKLVSELLMHKGKAKAVVPRHSEGKIEPLYGVYSYEVLAIVKNQIEKENYKLMNLLEACETFYYDVLDEFMRENPVLFKNINNPKDVN